jgi:hypothetical protein
MMMLEKLMIGRTAQRWPFGRSAKTASTELGE